MIVPVFQEYWLTERQLKKLKDDDDLDFDIGEYLHYVAQEKGAKDFIYVAENSESPDWDGKLTKVNQPFNEHQCLVGFVWKVNDYVVSTHFDKFAALEIQKIKDETEQLTPLSIHQIIRGEKLDDIIGDE